MHTGTTNYTKIKVSQSIILCSINNNIIYQYQIIDGYISDLDSIQNTQDFHPDTLYSIANLTWILYNIYNFAIAHPAENPLCLCTRMNQSH